MGITHQGFFNPKNNMPVTCPIPAAQQLSKWGNMHFPSFQTRKGKKEKAKEKEGVFLPLPIIFPYPCFYQLFPHILPSHSSIPLTISRETNIPTVSFTPAR